MATCLPSKMSETAVPVIITRAQPGADQTAERVRALGHTTIVSPALDLFARDEPLPDLAMMAGLVFTSANGVRFFAQASEVRDLPAWCVGPATAAEALREGFSPVHESSGNAQDLAHYIAHHWSGGDKPLLHIANAAAKGELRTALETEGFAVAFLPLYEARRADVLSPEALAAITSGQRAVVLGHSAKGMEAFASLAAPLDLSETEFVVISKNAASPLETIATAGVHIVDHPDEDHLISVLERVLDRG